MDDLTQLLIEFIKTHRDWAIAVIFITAFGESLAFVSLLFPGTVLLIAAGSLMKAGDLPYLPLMAGAILGAVLGDFLSYWIGRRLGGGVARLWPFTRHPEMLTGGTRFFERHGGKSVFIGRFSGPIRAVITLAAGIMGMSHGRFAFATVASALIWAPLLLFAGDVLGRVGERLFGSGNTVLLVFGGLTLIGVGAAVWAAVHSARSKP